MAISPIGVSFRGSYNTSFTGRKDNNRSSHATSPVLHKLAIPAAALILSMYPSDSMNAQGKFDTEKVTELYKKTQNFEILHSRVLENWAKYAKEEDLVPKLTVHFISTDGNEDNIEGVILESSTTKYNKDMKIFLRAKYLKIIEEKNPKGDVIDVRYTCCGDATVFNKSGVRQESNFHVGMSKESFDYLSQLTNSEMNNRAILKSVIIVEK